jgi:hypothetical protein
MSKMDDGTTTVFQQFRNSKPVIKLGSFLKKKLRPKSNNAKEDKSARWTSGIEKKRKNEYNSPINKLRRKQTRNWVEGGIYGSPAIGTRKSKKVLMPKIKESQGSHFFMFWWCGELLTYQSQWNNLCIPTLIGLKIKI